MENCRVCGYSPERCCCVRIGLEHCGLCTRPGSRSSLAWVGKPNPFGAWRGEVFSHYECKDVDACVKHIKTVDWKAIQAES